MPRAKRPAARRRSRLLALHGWPVVVARSVHKPASRWSYASRSRPPRGERPVISNAVFVTCAVTGSGDSVKKSPHVPVTPPQIAAAALQAHAAGAAIVHIHVRDPATGASSRDPALFREVFQRIREKNEEV